MEQAFKIAVQEACQALVNQQVADLKDALADKQAAANNETKSSAGDKHETGRAMAQLETEKLTAQLSEALKTKEALGRIEMQTSSTIQLGSLIKTNKGLFYLAVGLGKLAVDNEIVFAISTQSPMGKSLLLKKVNEVFELNGNSFKIEKIL